MAKNTGKNTDNLIPWKKGDPSPNPSGRPKGQRNFATIHREALIKIGESNNKTPEEIENMINEVGLKNALKGDYRFYKDTQDRIHGKAEEKVDVTGNVTFILNESLVNRDEVPRDTK